MSNSKLHSKKYSKKPVAIIVNGANSIGIKLAELLIENNSFVIFIDDQRYKKELDNFGKDDPISFYTKDSIPFLDEEIKRLDYLFYFQHKSTDSKDDNLDTLLALSTKNKAKFLLTKSLKSDEEEDITLVKEYIKKVKLNGRIIYVGEIIGDDMDFSANSPIARLILNASRGEALQIPKNTLEKEYLVHSQDLAQGLYKAMMSRVSEGDEYLLAYDNPYTYISIAYKVQEIEGEAEDLEFYEYKHSSSKRKLKSLAEIGWKPKISIEKALKQSISYAKIHNLDLTPDKKKTRLKLFFRGDRGKDNDEMVEMGAVTRLILERKKQEEESKRILEKNMSELKKLNKGSPIRLHNLVSTSNGNLFNRLRNKFRDFKEKPRSSKLKIILISTALLFLYLFVISPFLVIIKNTGVIIISYNHLKESFVRRSYESIATSSRNISASLDETKMLLGGYDFIPSILGYQQEYQGLKEVISLYSDLFDGVDNIIYGSESFTKFLESFQAEINYTEGDLFSLSIAEDSNEYESLILDSIDRSPYIKLGIDKLNKAIRDLNQVDYTVFPPILSDNLIALNQKSREWASELSPLSTVESVPDILGIYGERSYLLSLIDNTQPTNIGGKYKISILLKILNGKISEVRYIEDDLSVKLEDPAIINDLNQLRDEPIESLSKLSDLEYINDFERYKEILSKAIERSYGVNIDGVVLFNTSALESLIFKFSEGTSFVSGGVDYSKTPFLSSLNDKDKVLPDLFVKIFKWIVLNMNENYTELFEQINDELKSQDIIVSTNIQEYQNYILENNFNGSKIKKEDIFADPSIYIKNTSETSNYFEINNSTSVKILDSQIISIKNKFNFSEGVEDSIFSICIPLYVNRDSIQFTGVSPELIKFKTGKSEQCIVINIGDSREIEFGWNVSGFSFEGNERELSFGIGAINGVRSTLSIEITTEPSIKIIKQPEDFQETGVGVYSNSQYVSSDKSIRLTIKK